MTTRTHTFRIDISDHPQAPIASVWYHNGSTGGHNGDIVISPEYGSVPTRDADGMIDEQIRRCGIYGWPWKKIEVIQTASDMRRTRTVLAAREYAA